MARGNGSPRRGSASPVGSPRGITASLPGWSSPQLPSIEDREGGREMSPFSDGSAAPSEPDLSRGCYQPLVVEDGVVTVKLCLLSFTNTHVDLGLVLIVQPWAGKIMDALDIVINLHDSVNLTHVFPNSPAPPPSVEHSQSRTNSFNAGLTLSQLPTGQLSYAFSNTHTTKFSTQGSVEGLSYTKHGESRARFTLRSGSPMLNVQYTTALALRGSLREPSVKLQVSYVSVRSQAASV